MLIQNSRTNENGGVHMGYIICLIIGVFIGVLLGIFLMCVLQMTHKNVNMNELSCNKLNEQDDI